MSDWKTVVAHIATNIEDHYDQLKNRLLTRLGSDSAVQICSYYGHGTSKALHIRGRVLRDNGLTSAHDNDTVWLNLLNMYRRFNSHEVPFAKLRATFGSMVEEFSADEEGLFDVALLPQEPLPDKNIWHDVTLELIEDPYNSDTVGTKATANVLVPPPTAQFAVISDLDDTVIQSDVIHWLRLARNTFLYNSHTRLPFAGVAEFYQALQKGTLETAYNPIYYVSSSPWNLYDLLVDFFEVRGIPRGPLFLTNLGLSTTQLVSPSHEQHKIKVIEELLGAHTDLPFILIGDSGQKDAEIYTDIAHRYPGRIPVIYIRDVTGDERDKAITELFTRMQVAGTTMLLVKDTVAAAVHAAEHGYILHEALPSIRQERAEDKQPPVPVEELVEKITEVSDPQQ